MYIEQLYTNCLSEAAYYIESNGEAAIVDPLRDTDSYIRKAKDRKTTIKYVFETHFHADFISGHIDLADKTNAPIIFGPRADPAYEIHKAFDGEKFKLGAIEIEAIHTPGHTLESTSYLVFDEKGNKNAVFTGDTLFVGDVGRPDLLGGDYTPEFLAGQLYESLNKKIKPLPDEVIVYPAHGSGSSCGRNLGSETFSTIGQEKLLNYALQKMTKKEFIKKLTEGLADPPKHFPFNAQKNRDGYEPLEKVMNRGLVAIPVDDFEIQVNKGTFILDSRESQVFEQGFIPGSINIGLNGRFAEWVGSLVENDRKILLITPEGKEEETILRMARVGFENVEGYLRGGFETWSKTEKPQDMIISIDPDEFQLDWKHDKGISLVDVRKDKEYVEGHLDGAYNFSLRELEDYQDELGKREKIYLHCQTGYRSMIAASILKRYGFQNIKNINGGIEGIESVGMKIIRPKKGKTNTVAN